MRSARLRSGLTLLELVVVIGILMALSGILVVTLPDLLTSANNATLVTNIKDVDDMVQTWGNTHRGVYPTGWDSLVTASGEWYAYLPAVTAATPVGNAIKKSAVTPQQAARLKRAGITTVCDMTYAGGSTDTQNATLKASDVAHPETITANTTTLAFVNVGSVAGGKMEFQSTHDYAIFGLGRGTDLLGTGGVIKDQPVILHNQGCKSPSTTYCAPCVIFDLGEPTTDTRDTVVAKYVGCVALAESLFLYSEEKTTIY